MSLHKTKYKKKYIN